MPWRKIAGGGSRIRPYGSAPRALGLGAISGLRSLSGPAFVSRAASRVSRAIYEATFETILDGVKTADLGGSADTTEFTDEIIRHIRTKLEVWSALA